MADNETIADIIAEMRGGPIPQHRHDRELLRYFADRFEAAIKRERAKIEADALEVGGIVEAAHRRECGDAAKLREALESIASNLEHRLFARYPRSASDEWMYQKANTALSAPPRNCDKYATADEALKAQEQMFNNSNFANGECKLGCPECDNPRVGCKIAWLFATATEKEGGDDAN